MAAKDIFLAEGYERTTMRRIAQALGITPTTLYLHFADKNALMNEIANQGLSVLASRFKSQLAAAASPRAAFRAFLDVYVDFALSHPREYRLLFMTEAPREVPGHRSAPGHAFDPSDKGAQAFGALEGLVRELVARGEFAPGDPATLAESIWAATHGLVSLLITYPHFPWTERSALIDAHAKMIVEGLEKK